MKPIEIICQDLFDKIRSRFQNLEMGDEKGSVTLNPGDARFFDFDFVYENTDLGRVSISLNDIGSLKIFYSKGITEGKDDFSKRLWYNFLKEMRMFAMKRLLRFDTRDINKENLDKNDFQYLATKTKKDQDMSQMNESRWNGKNSRKTSRAVTNKTKVIVRHVNPVDETRPATRSQRNNIKSIFIESPLGERFMYPLKHLEGACAMAQHVEHGGKPHDSIGRKIISISEEIAQLQEFNRQVLKSQLHNDAMKIAETANARLQELKKLIFRIGQKRFYETWSENLNQTQDKADEFIVSDLDPVTMEDYKNKFTQKNFKEEFTEFFPLLHKIMQETNTVDLEEYVNEGEGKHTVHCSQCGGEFKSDNNSGFSHCKDHQGMKNYDLDEKPVNEFADFEQWAETTERTSLALEDTELSQEKKEQLKKELDNITNNMMSDTANSLTLDNAYEFLSQFIQDEDLEEKYEAAQEFKSMEPLEPFKEWAREKDQTDLLKFLGLDKEETQDQAQAQPQAPEVVAPPAAATAQTPPQPVAENLDAKSILVKEVAKIVNQFYNKEHVHQEDLGPFPKGEEGICLEVQKRVTEKFSERMPEKMAERMGQQAATIARQFMERLVQKDLAKQENEELSRIKSLSNSSVNYESQIEVANESITVDVNMDIQDLKKLSGLVK